MAGYSRCWLLVNPASGSNDERSQRALEDALTAHGMPAERVIRFPEDDLPSAAELDRAGIDLVVVFTGDGTINALVSHLAGWGGAILILPGGTMNLLARRLHRDLEIEQILGLVSQGGAIARRPECVSCEAGTALAGLLVGPGTCWAEVRESMRNGAITEVAAGALDALQTTANGPPVKVQASALARPEGYPLVELTPGEHGLQINGFYAEEAFEFAAQAWATLRRRFREGPNDHLGIVRELVLESADGGPLPVLIDGEPAKCPAIAKFVVAPCEVNLLATSHEQ